MEDLAFRSALELSDLIKRREISPVEVVGAYLERVDKFDSTLNAFVTLLPDEALDAARAAEQEAGDDDAPAFLGVPIPIKDLAETRGVKTTFSSRAYADYVPQEDSAVVRRLREAGFILIGKSNTSEFGTFPVTESELNGVCRTPWDTDLTSGGSSGGAGAAVAAGMAPVAQGSDGGGSIRIPASCCGIFGLKPARGRVSVGPQLGESWAGFSTSGPLARTVADAAALLDVMAGYELGDPYWAPPPERPFRAEVGVDPGRLRVGLVTEAATGVPVSPEVVAAAEDAARLLESLGHAVEPVDFSWIEGADVTSQFIKIVATTTAYHPGVDLSLVEPANRALAEAAQATPSLTYVEAVQSLQATTRRVLSLFDDLDLLLTPTLALPPVAVGWMFEPDDPWEQLVRAGMFVPFTPLANFTGLPAVSLPLHWNEKEIPIGVQLVGGPADEATLIRVSSQLEEARPWRDRRPPVS